jgi:hypothetical protein
MVTVGHTLFNLVFNQVDAIAIISTLSPIAPPRRGAPRRIPTRLSRRTQRMLSLGIINVIDVVSEYIKTPLRKQKPGSWRELGTRARVNWGAKGEAA